MITPLLASAQGGENEVLNFAVGWRVDSRQQENVLQLGSVYPCPTGWCVVVEEYSGKLNLPRQRLNYKHAMRVATQTERCTDESLTTVRGTQSPALMAVLTQTASGYLLKAGRYRYSWRIDPVSPAAFVLHEAGPNGAGEANYSQPVGFAFWSDDARNTLFERNRYNTYFDGNIAHKNTLMRVRDDWQVTRTSLDFRKFSAAANGSSVLGRTTSGHPEVLKRLKKPVEVHHSVLPPMAATGDRLRFFNHEYGHDFNANGCFDEFGHNKIMLPVLQDNAVAAFVFVEYTHDKFDGVPMLSVGRYFRRK